MVYNEKAEMTLLLMYEMSMKSKGSKDCPECKLPMPVEKWAKKCGLCACRDMESEE